MEPTSNSPCSESRCNDDPIQPDDKQQTAMDSSETIAAAALVARVQHATAAQMRAEYPWMPSTAIEEIVENMSAVLRKGLAEQAPQMAAKRKRMDIFSLSAELRNIIYEMALDDHSDDGSGRVLIQDITKDDQSTSHYDPPLPGRLSRIPPALLLTSRQVRKETQSLYLARTSFMVRMTDPETGPAREWLEHLPLYQRTQIKKIVLEFHVNDLDEVYEMAYAQARSQRHWRSLLPDVRTAKDSVIKRVGLVVQGVEMAAFEVKCLAGAREMEFDEETCVIMSNTMVLCDFCDCFSEDPNWRVAGKLVCGSCGRSCRAQSKVV